MNTPLSDDLIKKLNDDSSFQQFLSYAVGIIDEVDTVSDLGNLSDSRAGQEAKSRDKAKVLVLKIFHPFLSFMEKKGPTKEERKAAAEKFGLNQEEE